MSLHGLMFPWFYLGVLAFVISQRRWLPRETGMGLAWMTISLLPFVFLAYQNHVPSRHEYLASMGLAWALSTLLANMAPARFRLGFIVGFAAINIGLSLDGERSAIRPPRGAHNPDARTVTRASAGSSPGPRFSAESRGWRA